jgi:hypothetical protein
MTLYIPEEKRRRSAKLEAFVELEQSLNKAVQISLGVIFFVLGGL